MGTFVNGTKTNNRTQLNDGDQVRFGDRGFKVVALAESGEPSEGGTTIIAGIAGVATLLQASEQDAAARVPKDSPTAAFGKTSERSAAAASSAISPEPEPGAGAIPASWADSNQLETSSQTAFVPRRPPAPGDAKEQRLPPLRGYQAGTGNLPSGPWLFWWV